MEFSVGHNVKAYLESKGIAQIFIARKLVFPQIR
jgi:hypothetical protein